MKTIILLLSLTTISHAGDMKLSCDVEPGWIPTAVKSEYRAPDDIKYLATENVFSLTVKPQFDWKFLYGWFEFSAYSAWPKKGVVCVPFRMSYSNELGVYHQFSSFKVSAGWINNCQHRVMITTYTDPHNHFNDFGYQLVFMRFHFSNSQ